MKKKLFPAALSLLVLWTAFILGCGEIGLTPQAPSRIEVQPATGGMLAYTIQRFEATGYDSGGHEVFFTPFWAVYTVEAFGKVLYTGRNPDNSRPYADFELYTVGSIELYCFYSDVRGFASIEGYATVESITVTPAGATVEVGYGQEYLATVKDPNGNILNLVTPTWEIESATVIGTINPAGFGYARFNATATGEGIINAYFYGVKGSVEVMVLPSP